MNSLKYSFDNQFPKTKEILKDDKINLSKDLINRMRNINDTFETEKRKI
jgi:hypothetical protein